MRIPPEAIPPVPNVGHEVEAERKVEPLASTPRIPDGFAAALHERLPPHAENRAPSQPATHATTGSVAPQPESPLVPVERRQAERRSENRPVLLDTRSNRGRRRGVDDARINIKV